MGPEQGQLAILPIHGLGALGGSCSLALLALPVLGQLHGERGDAAQQSQATLSVRGGVVLDVCVKLVLGHGEILRIVVASLVK